MIADIDRPLSFEAMADDIAALIRHFGLGPKYGAAQAIQHPDLVSRLVLILVPFARLGWYPEVFEGMARIARANWREGLTTTLLAK